jgi:ACT domain-containing protein
MAHFNLNVSKLNTNIQKDGTVKLDLRLINGSYMDDLVKELKNLDSVEHVRVTKPGIFG